MTTPARLDEIRLDAAKFESILLEALEQKYRERSPEHWEKLMEHHPIKRWDSSAFLSGYVGGGHFPLDRLERTMRNLFDIKLQMYFLMEVDVGLYNLLVHDRLRDGVDIRNKPHVLLTRMSLDQNLIGKSRILWERMLNFVYYLETGEQLENRVSINRSKVAAFRELLDSAPVWRFMEPYLGEIEKYDAKYRTPEFHKSSILRAELFGHRTTDSNELLRLLNRAMNNVWENILSIVGGKQAVSFTDGCTTNL